MYRFFLPFLIFLLFLAPVEAAELDVENLRLHLEFTSQARCFVEASAFVQGDQPLSRLQLDFRASLSNSSLRSTLEGEIQGLPERLENLLLSLSPPFLNAFLSSYEGKTLREIREGSGGLPAIEFVGWEFPEGMENLVLKEIEVRKLKGLHPGVRFSLFLALEGMDGRGYFPLSFWLSLERVEDGALLSARAEFGLPHEGNRVVVSSFPLPLKFLKGFSLRNFSLILKVPEGAEVSGIPDGFENQGGTYFFSGENMELFQTLVCGLEGMNLSYEYSPPSSSLPLLPFVVFTLVVLASFLFLRAFYLKRRKKGR